mmetsp:Transcript_3682/g.12160  ORF Transcript_3682/g.12160 Transcript_3682/m.12160 type:complete len:219 (+) Transcript_3682:342-998(+)
MCSYASTSTLNSLTKSLYKPHMSAPLRGFPPSFVCSLTKLRADSQIHMLWVGGWFWLHHFVRLGRWWPQSWLMHAMYHMSGACSCDTRCVVPICASNIFGQLSEIVKFMSGPEPTFDTRVAPRVSSMRASAIAQNPSAVTIPSSGWLSNTRWREWMKGGHTMPRSSGDLLLAQKSTANSFTNLIALGPWMKRDATRRHSSRSCGVALAVASAATASPA